MNILVVEDDFISRRLLCRYLEKAGNCDVAINGAEAVAAVHDALDSGEHYDLICLDIMMPGMGGQEALAAIRDLELEHGIQVGQGARVVMTTALEDHGNVRQAFKASADGYVVKPIEKLKLFKLLAELGLQAPVAG
ncbi:MAG: response regulator [bacterium]|nr:response regulator [bacterium]